MFKSFKQAKLFKQMKISNKKYSTNQTRCIFQAPQTPKQKLMCFSAGIIASGLTMTGIYYGTKHCVKLYTENTDLNDNLILVSWCKIIKIGIDTIDTVDKYICDGVKYISKHTNEEIAATTAVGVCAPIIIGFPGIVSAYYVKSLVKSCVNDYGAVKNMTECCKIIRKSASLLPKTIWFGAIAGAYGMVTYRHVLFIPYLHEHYLKIQEE